MFAVRLDRNINVGGGIWFLLTKSLVNKYYSNRASYRAQDYAPFACKRQFASRPSNRLEIFDQRLALV
jgi:hypothetical protein